MVSVQFVGRRNPRDGRREAPDIAPPGHPRRSYHAAMVTLLALAGFAEPAGASRLWDDIPAPIARELSVWTAPGASAKLPRAAVYELVQNEGTGDAVVPPVKRQAPQMPSAAPEPKPAEPKPAEPKPAETKTAPNTAEPKTAAPAQPAAPEKPRDRAESEPQPAAPAGGIGSIFAPLTDWLAKANREYQGRIVKELSKPSKEALEAEARRLAEERAAQEKADREARAAEAARKAEEAKQAAAEDARRKAEAEARKQAEAAAAKQAEAARQAEAAKQSDAQKAEAARKADEVRKAEEAKKSEEAKKVEEARKADEARKAEAAKKAEDTRKAEETRKIEEARKAAADADARRQREAEAKRQEQARKEEQARKQQQAEAGAKAREERLAQERRSAREQEERRIAREKEEQRIAQEKRPRPEPEAAAARQPAQSERHRRWSVTIIPEPIGRPAAEPVAGRPELAAARVREDGGVLLGSRRLSPRMSLGAGSVAGPAVKRWVWRAGACRFAGRKAAGRQRYTVAKGDSLWRISEKHYDAGARYPRIYRANRDRIADPDLIYPCQKFRVPRR